MTSLIGKVIGAAHVSGDGTTTLIVILNDGSEIRPYRRQVKTLHFNEVGEEIVEISL